jgi:uncharacterized protein (DUF302 family)
VPTTTIGMTRELSIGFDDALVLVESELQHEGFGVLTQIDVAETLKRKLGVDFRRYRILGACNPPLAHRALSEEVNAGVFLPCNVVVYEADNGRTVVTAVDPLQTVAALGRPALSAVAQEVRDKLERVVQRIPA